VKEYYFSYPSDSNAQLHSYLKYSPTSTSTPRLSRVSLRPNLGKPADENRYPETEIMTWELLTPPLRPPPVGLSNRRSILPTPYLPWEISPPKGPVRERDPNSWYRINRSQTRGWDRSPARTAKPLPFWPDALWVPRRNWVRPWIAHQSNRALYLRKPTLPQHIWESNGPIGLPG